MEAYFIIQDHNHIAMAAAASLGVGTYNHNYSHHSTAYFSPKIHGTPLCFLSWDSRKAPLLLITDSKPKASRHRPTIIMATETDKLGIEIVNNPPESKLSDLGVRSWPKWGCPPSNFPWTYTAKETCYLLKGKVKVYPDGSKEAVEIGAGDLVVFPKGMSCTWDVSEAVDKHYQFD